MILLALVAAEGLIWLVIGGMVLTAVAVLIPTLLVLFLFALIRALVRPGEGSR